MSLVLLDQRVKTVLEEVRAIGKKVSAKEAGERLSKEEIESQIAAEYKSVEEVLADHQKSMEEAKAKYGKSLTDPYFGTGIQNTETAGQGAELARHMNYSDMVIKKLCSYSPLLPMLPGSHGDGLAITEKVPIIGEVGYFQLNPEWKSGTKIDAWNSLPMMTKNTDMCEIKQTSFIAACPISKKMMNYSLVDLEAEIFDMMGRSASRSIDSYIINGDPTRDATNINCKGLTDAAAWAASQMHYLGGAHGLRYHGLKGNPNVTGSTPNTFNIGPYTDSDFLVAKSKLGCYGADKGDLLFIMSNSSECSILGLECVKDASINGSSSSFTTGVVNRAYNIPIFTTIEYPDMTDADGCVNNDTALNEFGSYALIKRSAVQYGFGQNLEIDIAKVPGKGLCVVACFDFGYCICDGEVKSDRTVAIGIKGEVIGS